MIIVDSIQNVRSRGKLQYAMIILKPFEFLERLIIFIQILDSNITALLLVLVCVSKSFYSVFSWDLSVNLTLHEFRDVNIGRELWHKLSICFAPRQNILIVLNFFNPNINCENGTLSELWFYLYRTIKVMSDHFTYR